MHRFRARCSELGLAATHQRQAIYRAMAGSEEHPQPEAIYRRVKRLIPAISLATVYKNLKTFVAMGLLREVGSEPGSYRLDANLDRHHHLVCVRCKAVVDFYDARLDRIRATQSHPKNFRILRYQVEALGVCPACRLKFARIKRQHRGDHTTPSRGHKAPSRNREEAATQYQAAVRQHRAAVKRHRAATIQHRAAVKQHRAATVRERSQRRTHNGKSR